MIYEVYVHVFPNEKKYVGLTKLGTKNRWKDGKGYKSQLVRRAIDKYGWDNIEHLVVFTTEDKNKAEMVERLIIRSCRTNNKDYGYNVESGGQFGAIGIKRSKQTLEKMSKANTGKKIKDETRAKISQSLKGRIITEEQRKKISIAQMGNKNHRFGKRLTEEELVRKRMSTKKGADCPNARRVLQFDKDMNLIKSWNCIQDIKRELNIDHSLICACCLGKQKTSRGYIWRYADDYRR